MFLGVHESRLFKSNSPSNFSHLSSMVIMLFSSASGLSTMIVSGMMFAATIRAIGVPFGIHMGTSFLLYSSTETCCLLILYLVKTSQMYVPLRRGGSSHLSGSVIMFIWSHTELTGFVLWRWCLSGREVFHFGCTHNLLM